MVEPKSSNKIWILISNVEKKKRTKESIHYAIRPGEKNTRVSVTLTKNGF